MAETFRLRININLSLKDGASKAPPSASCKPLVPIKLQQHPIHDMNKLLNFITIFFGILMLFAGILKYFDMFRSLELGLGNMYLKVPNSTSMIYNIFINFIGGGSMIYHSISTLNFKKNALVSQNYELTNNIKPELKLMSKLSMITGLITLVVSLWLIIRTTVILTSFDGSLMQLLPLFILAFILYGSFSLIPIILAGQNVSLNNKIGQIIELKNKADLRAKNQNSNKTRR